MNHHMTLHCADRITVDLHEIPETEDRPEIHALSISILGGHGDTVILELFARDAEHLRELRTQLGGTP